MAIQLEITKRERQKGCLAGKPNYSKDYKFWINVFGRREKIIFKFDKISGIYPILIWDNIYTSVKT